jgi:hypothetical protein
MAVLQPDDRTEANGSWDVDRKYLRRVQVVNSTGKVSSTVHPRAAMTIIADLSGLSELQDGRVVVTFYTSQGLPVASVNMHRPAEHVPAQREVHEQVVFTIPWLNLLPGSFDLEVKVLDGPMVVEGIRIPAAIDVYDPRLDALTHSAIYGEGRVYMHSEWSIRHAESPPS